MENMDGHHIIPANQKLMRIEDLKNSHCGGRAVLTTPSDKLCPSNPLLWTTSEKLKSCNSNPEITNTGAPQKTSTSSPLMSASLPASSSVSPWSSTTSCSRNPPGFPDSVRPTTQEIFLQRHMEVDRNGKMSSGRPYNWLSICFR